ncbi:unnamed protein product [Rangifer tarandus platyrhynchus]|uniref:Uncharacterized protein n=1 Tax=Rangifer tarandus platyrhynchus TaxID=3082113 RepID=A0ABN8XJ65_RANTA|nr:unnamed protein product [Rangifer tarandus platyrhynchus]
MRIPLRVRAEVVDCNCTGGSALGQATERACDYTRESVFYRTSAILMNRMYGRVIRNTTRRMRLPQRVQSMMDRAALLQRQLLQTFSLTLEHDQDIQGDAQASFDLWRERSSSSFYDVNPRAIVSQASSCRAPHNSPYALLHDNLCVPALHARVDVMDGVQRLLLHAFGVASKFHQDIGGECGRRVILRQAASRCPPQASASLSLWTLKHPVARSATIGSATGKLGIFLRTGC